jgi:hypothetical protein
MENNKIPLSCPFCGARAFVSKAKSVVGDYNFRVYCGNEDCHVMPQSRYFPTREKAIFFWNVREKND